MQTKQIKKEGNYQMLCFSDKQMMTNETTSSDDLKLLKKEKQNNNEPKKTENALNNNQMHCFQKRKESNISETNNEMLTSDGV